MHNQAQPSDGLAGPDPRPSEVQQNVNIPPQEGRLNDAPATVLDSGGIKGWISAHPLEAVLIAGGLVYLITKRKD